MVFRQFKIWLLLVFSLLFFNQCSDFNAIFNGNKRSPKVAKKTPESKKSPASSKKNPPYHAKGKFIWPLKAPVTSYYGSRSGGFHEGIDIDGKSGDPFVASASGEVVFEGRLGGYGKLIVIKHDHGLFTAYAHNKKNLVHEKQQVKQGQKIGLVGATGNAQGDHLHFEVRDENGHHDPMKFLP
ncbi:MAG: M23 family metallopeptidase [Deltaproteobacteria bacterium]|nr:M23 family metallopeptidase [Deltaproteobacteria bacterium]